MTDSVRSRLPKVDGLDPNLGQFLETVDRRQLRFANLDDLDPAATLADVIEKINLILETQRTK